MGIMRPVLLTRSVSNRTVLALLLAVCPPALPAQGQAHLGLRERQTPLFKALAAGLGCMPPATDSLFWTEALSPIRNVIHPVWHKLDPIDHMDVLRALVFDYGWDEVTHPELAKVHQLKMAPTIEKRLLDEIRNGRIQLEETTVPTIEFEAAPDLKDEMGLYRVTEWSWS